jgi:hypothetical protein
MILILHTKYNKIIKTRLTEKRYNNVFRITNYFLICKKWMAIIL